MLNYYTPNCQVIDCLVELAHDCFVKDAVSRSEIDRVAVQKGSRKVDVEVLRADEKSGEVMIHVFDKKNFSQRFYMSDGLDIYGKVHGHRVEIDQALIDYLDTNRSDPKDVKVLVTDIIA